jgi:hypothetical protein
MILVPLEGLMLGMKNTSCHIFESFETFLNVAARACTYETDSVNRSTHMRVCEGEGTNYTISSYRHGHGVVA